MTLHPPRLRVPSTIIAACLLPAECKMDAFLAGKGSDGAVSTFSKTMALRRLHWKNSLLAELLYAVNVFKVCVCGGGTGMISGGVGGCRGGIGKVAWGGEGFMGGEVGVWFGTEGVGVYWP